MAATPGDNTVARNLAKTCATLRCSPGNTTTFGDAWSQLVYRVGQDSATAKGEMESRSEGIVRQIENLQDSVAGVSLDEEAPR